MHVLARRLNGLLAEHALLRNNLVVVYSTLAELKAQGTEELIKLLPAETEALAVPDNLVLAIHYVDACNDALCVLWAEANSWVTSRRAA